MELVSRALTVIKGETNWWKELEGRWFTFDHVFSPIHEEADLMTQLGNYDVDIIEEVLLLEKWYAITAHGVCNSSIKFTSFKWQGPQKQEGSQRDFGEAPGRYTSQVCEPGKNSIWLGTFDPAEEAAGADDATAREFPGHKAKTNFTSQSSILYSNTFDAAEESANSANVTHPYDKATREFMNLYTSL
nr:ethylene-responsive transcription factor 4-like [Arachis hypogaea]